MWVATGLNVTVSPPSVFHCRRELTLSDLRLLLGVERRVTGGINSRVEIGYVFDRKLEFQESLPTFEADPTLLVRGGLTY